MLICNVTDKPVLRSISNITYGFVDEIVSVTCEVSANPNPWFVWYDKNRIPLDPKNDKVNITVHNDTSVLKVKLKLAAFIGLKISIIRIRSSK